MHDGLALTGLNSYRTGSTVYVVGQLQNNTGGTVRYPRAIATLFSSDGTVLETSYTYPFSGSDVLSGATASFSLSFYDSPG